MSRRRKKGRAAAGPPPPDPRAVRRAAGLAIGAVLVLSVAVPPLAAGRAWAFPQAWPGAGALARALPLAAALFGALWLWEAGARRLASRSARVAASLATGAALAAVMAAIVPPTYIGDWQWMLWIAEDGRPLGKWYGASLVYAAAHRWIGAPAGLTPFSSVRIVSAACGAATAYVWFRLAARAGWTRASRLWPALYLSAFGVIGIGLGHLEVYAPVALILALYLLAATRALEAPSSRTLLVFALVAGLALGAYVSMLLLAPVTLVLLFLALRRAPLPSGTRALLACAALALLVTPLLAERAIGPEPIQGHLLDFWGEQAARDAAHLPRAKAFQPADVYWPLIPHFMAPKYWFSGWHLGDIAQQALLDDRVGLALALGLLPLFARRRRRDLAAPAVAVPLALAAVFLAYGFALVNGRPYPWDWDLFSYAALPTSVLAAALLGRGLAPARLGRAGEGLLLLAGLASIATGVQFFLDVPRTPGAFGPAIGGLRLAVVPERFTLAPGRPAHLWLWLANETDEPRHVRPGRITYSLDGESATRSLVQAPRRRAVVGGRWVPAHGIACLHDFTYDPTPVRVGPRGAGERRRAPIEAAPPDRFRGRLLLDLGPGPAGDRQLLPSNPLEIETRPE